MQHDSLYSKFLKSYISALIHIHVFLIFLIFLTYKNPVYNQTDFILFPKEQITVNRIFYTTKYGYREDHSWLIEENNFYSINTNNPADSKIMATCNTCEPIIITAIPGQKVYPLNPEYTDLAIGSKNIRLRANGKAVYMLVISLPEELSIYISTITQRIQPQLTHQSVNTTFPFFIYFNDQISDSMIDSEVYAHRFEQDHYLGLKKDWSSIYIDNSITKYRAAHFARTIRTWNDSANIKLIAFHALISFLLTLSLNLVIRSRKNIYAFCKRWHRRNYHFSIFLGVYTAIIFIFFSEGVGDWAIDWESMFVRVNFLEFSHLNSDLYQALSYVFYLTSYKARAFFCLCLFILIICLYNSLLKETLKSKIFQNFFLFFILFSPVLLIHTFHTQRYYFTTLITILGLILTFYSLIKNTKNKIYFIAAYTVLSFAIFIRLDFIIYLLPLLYCHWLKNKTWRQSIITFILALLPPTLAFMSQNTNFRASYISVSYRESFRPYFETLHESITKNDYDFLVTNGLMSEFMPPLSPEMNQRFIKIVGTSIINDPSIMLKHNWQKLKNITLSLPFYRGLNAFGNNPYEQFQREDVGARTVETISNNALSRNFHYYINFLALQLREISFYRFYWILFLPVFFILHCKFSGSLAIVFLLKFIILFFTAPAPSHLYLEEFNYWLHFSIGVFIIEYIHSKNQVS